MKDCDLSDTQRKTRDGLERRFAKQNLPLWYRLPNDVLKTIRNEVNSSWAGFANENERKEATKTYLEARRQKKKADDIKHKTGDKGSASASDSFNSGVV